DLRGTLGVRPAREDGLHLCGCGLVPDAGLVAGEGEAVDGEVGGDVHDGAGDGGDGDAPAPCDIPPIDRACPVNADPLDSPIPRGRHLRNGRLALQNAPQIGGRSPTQHGRLPTRTDSSEVTGLDAWCAMPD